MENWERSPFEEEWKDALEGAEVAPAKGVWSALDQALTHAEGNSMRRSIIFYQRLAAACVLFALAAGTFGVYHWRENTQRVLAKNEGTNFKSPGEIKTGSADSTHGNTLVDGHKSDELKLNGHAGATSSHQTGNSNLTRIDSKKMDGSNGSALLAMKNETTVKDNVGKPNKVALSQTEGSAEQNKIASNKVRDEGTSDFQLTGNPIDVKTDSDSSEQVAFLQSANSKMSTHPEPQGKMQTGRYTSAIDLSIGNLKAQPEVALKGKPVYVEIIRQLPAISPVFMNAHREEKTNHEKLWASVSAAAGTFSNNNGGSSYNALNSSSSPTGSAYTMGMVGGVRIAKRWVLQSGVQYMNQSAGYASNISGTSLSAVSHYAYNPAVYTNVGNAGSFSTAPYDIVSTNEFVTVPVQAGYLLLDRKLGWQINPGIATDFFVRNTLTDPSGQRQTYSQGAGSDSPYRSVNFAGLMSSEVSYKIGKSYRVSLVPGFRYTLNPVLKSQTSGNPLVWDVAFRLRYIFK